MQAEFFISSEKCAKRIEGKTLNLSLGSCSISEKIISAPGSLLGSITTKLRPEIFNASKKLRACSAMLSCSEVTG